MNNEKQAKKIEVGAAVRVKHLPNAPTMIILSDYADTMSCFWFNANIDLQQDNFPIDLLELIPDQKQPF